MSFARRILDLGHARNRARKSRFMDEYGHRHQVRTVLLVGAGGADRPWENQVERAIAADADLAVWCGIERRDDLTPYVVCDARALPFRTGAVDLVFSNAVIEHVGGVADQAALITEHSRVGRTWALTTPNRWFPVEAHTRALFRHWLPAWRRQRNEFTRLLSRGELRALLPPRAGIAGTTVSPTLTAFAEGRRR